ncbi:MAG TPA: hypothetical protein VN541_09065, partial [Tepidisphaeraceae bacterium]|nr:hypothetical protein [Tepidisphaeraceae bacterium]
MLDLLASIIFFSALTAAAMLVWRRLPRAAAAAAGEPVCLACRTPARLLAADSFVCPTCGRDVREAGIGLARPRGFLVPFWRLVNFSAGLCLVALIVMGIVAA